MTNFGDAVWSGTRKLDGCGAYISRDLSFIKERAIALGSVRHANANFWPGGRRFLRDLRQFKLPPGTDGQYYIYVIADNYDSPSDVNQRQPKMEYLRSANNSDAFEFYSVGRNGGAGSVFEGPRNDNNTARGTLDITYREPDLQIDSIVVSEPNPHSGETITVTWTVTNRGRVTRAHQRLVRRPVPVA